MHPQLPSHTSSQPSASTSITTNEDLPPSETPEETSTSLNLPHLPVSVKDLPEHLERWRPQIENIYAAVFHIEATMVSDELFDSMINDIIALGNEGCFGKSLFALLDEHLATLLARCYRNKVWVQAHISRSALPDSGH
ncbi:hypothetical protein DL765_005545 [Monosporascus sp. GIB2]|nr:hypothetical protein DL765_005545 [Monosporascus sp. GIB2]